MYAKGYIRDADHLRTQKDARHLLGSLGPPPVADNSLVHLEAPIFSQLSYSACTGHGTAQGLVIAMRSQGAALDFVPSPLGIYTVARGLDRAGAVDVPLTDAGAMPANVMKGISLFGVRPIGPLNPQGNTDCTDANINAEPGLAELERDASAIVVGEYRVDETAGDASEQVAACIAHGIPVGIGCFVDSGFAAWTAGSAPYGAPNQADPNGGGHWMVVVATRTAPGGAREFQICNSWGVEWGDAGHIWVTAQFIRAAWDLYPLTVRKAS